MNDSSTLKSILLLAANPKGTVSLRLQEEEREIRERLRLAGYGHGKVPINSTGATRTRDIQQAMLDFNPQIVHFTGHGAGKDGLAFEDGIGQPKLVDSDALANLFKLFSSRVECVVLNACYSQVQAEAIAQHIDYVIGMSQAIGDRAAIEFAVGFYTALGAGESIEFAYKLGCNAIQLEGIPEHLTPVLFGKKKDECVGANSQNLDEDISFEQAVGAVSTTIEPLTPKEFWERGKEKLDLGDYQGAIVDFNETIRLEPNYLDANYVFLALFVRGIAKLALEDHQGAVTDCTEAIRLRPNYPQLYYWRGIAKNALKDYKGAFVDFTKAIRLGPDNPHAYNCYNVRGWLKCKLHDYRGALSDFSESIRLKSDYANSYNGRGWAKHYLSDHQGAITDFN